MKGLLIISPFTSCADKPKITIPITEVKTIPDFYVSCLAEGTPPINISLLKSSTPLASGVGIVMSRKDKEGNYTCIARNEVGTDSRDFPVAIVGKIENFFLAVS